MSIIRQSITSGKCLKFNYKNSLKEQIVHPVCVNTIYPYSTQKLITKDCGSLKIDSLKNLEIKDVPLNNLLPLANSAPKQPLELIFTFTNSDHYKEKLHIQNRILSEASWMECICKSEEKWIYTALVQDAYAYIPWIRTFHKYVSIGPNSYPSLITKLNNDRKEALSNYGII